ncbi:hypothetical protein N9059_01660 [bacterium]|nr:hypothetical protein [bacterium]
MRLISIHLLCASMLFNGCGSNNLETTIPLRPPELPTPTEATQWDQGNRSTQPRTNATEVTNSQVRGTIVMIDKKLSYVIIDFGVSRLPSPAQLLTVFNQGQKVGQVRISTQPNQSKGAKVVADVVEGELENGFEVYAVK